MNARAAFSGLLAVSLLTVLASAPASAQVSCSGVPAFANCTAYATGAAVVYNNTKYTAVATINSSRDCPPNSPFNPSTDNWWTNNGTCSGGATATATRTSAATATATTASRSTATATRTSTATATATTARATATGARATATATHAPTATATRTATATATTSGGGGSCSGIAVFANCTAYANGAKVQYNGTLYQALASIPNTRDCAPSSPNTPANDNWWGNLGTCTGGTPMPTPTSGGGGGGSSTGTVHFHLWLGASVAQDALALDGDNYTDLILSNMVAGVVYGRLIDENYPGLQYQKDYLYGSVFAQLLQENLATQMYQSTSNLIDPAADQQSVMGAGQGGPYQINNYVPDMVAPNSGHALVNFVAIQKNIGFTIAGMADQNSKVTPPSFNNKYYGPVLTSYFHYNDFVALQLIGKGPGGWQTPWEPMYDNTLVTFKSLPGNFLDVLLNVSYNQGFYGPLMVKYVNLGATATASTVTSVNSYGSVWGSTNTYEQYPYQVRYYLDQIYGNPLATGPSTFTSNPNHVRFTVPLLQTVFANVFQTLAYVNGSGQYAFYSASQANAAFASALTQAGVSSTATLDISTAAQRAQMFSVLEHAVANLEASTGSKLNATSMTQL